MRNSSHISSGWEHDNHWYPHSIKYHTWKKKQFLFNFLLNQNLKAKLPSESLISRQNKIHHPTAVLQICPHYWELRKQAISNLHAFPYVTNTSTYETTIFDLDTKILQRSKVSTKNRQDIYIVHNSRILYYWHLSVETSLNRNLRSAHHKKKENKELMLCLISHRVTRYALGSVKHFGAWMFGVLNAPEN